MENRREIVQQLPKELARELPRLPDGTPDLMAAILNEAEHPSRKALKFILVDEELKKIFYTDYLIPENMKYPEDFEYLEDLLNWKNLPENDDPINPAQILLGRHPLIERNEAVFTNDNVLQLPNGVFRDDKKMIILHSGVTAIDGKTKAVMLFAVDDPRHYEVVYGFVKINKDTDNNYKADKMATICQVFNCY